jgi:hypothetical protein
MDRAHLRYVPLTSKLTAALRCCAARHDYCNANVADVMAAVPKMRKALVAVGRDIVYYVDADTTERVYDPSHHDPRAARNWTELPWIWGPNMWKTWKGAAKAVRAAASAVQSRCFPFDHAFSVCSHKCRRHI